MLRVAHIIHIKDRNQQVEALRKELREKWDRKPPMIVEKHEECFLSTDDAFDIFLKEFPLWNVSREDNKLLYRDKSPFSKQSHIKKWVDHAEKLIERLQLPLVAVNENGLVIKPKK